MLKILLISSVFLLVATTVDTMANPLYPEYERRYPKDIGYARQQADKARSQQYEADYRQRESDHLYNNMMRREQQQKLQQHSQPPEWDSNPPFQEKQW